ncbi:MAG TPA: hypothetical protein VI259_13995 [Gemmatimonadaceae bacterium]
MYRPIALTLATIALCACSQKEAAKDSAAVAQSAKPSAANAFDPATHTATVHAKDFSFEGPDSVPAGWTTFHLINDGQTFHHIQLVRLDSGKTVQDLGEALKNTSAPPPRWMTLVGGPNAPSPGSSSDAAVNLQPGNYAMICVVDIPGHVPHVAKGMVRPLTVTAASGTPAAEPSADATISESDYKFDIPATIAAGNHTFKVVNSGPQPHEVELVRLAPGKTMKDFGEFMAKAYEGKADGPPPGDGVGGVTGLMPGGTAYFTANITPGDYVMICFFPDAKDGKPHSDHGMVKQFTVK